MIASVKSHDNVAAPAWHADFLAMLPAITEYAQFSIREWRGEAKEELLQEIIAKCFVTYHRLVERGKADLAFPSVLASFALRHVLSGRRIGGRLSIRDVMSRHAQRTCGIAVERLDRFDDQEGDWKDVLVEDKHAGPAETAAARIDVAAWLQSLTSRDRRIAEMLATGEKTGEVAERFGLTDARISQLRTLLRESWERLQGELGDREPRYAEAL